MATGRGPESIRIDRYCESDADSVLALFEACYGGEADRRPTQDEWRWRGEGPFHGNPIWVARAGEQVVGLRPAVVREAFLSGRAVRAVHFRDAMTHPHYRRKGIFSELVRAAVDELSEWAEFAYCFPNADSLRVYRTLPEWRCVLDVPLYVYAARPIRLQNLKASMGAKAYAVYCASRVAAACVRGRTADCPHELRARIRRANRLDERFDELWNRLASRLGAAFPRKADYLTWRYLERPSVPYAVHTLESESSGELRGYAIARTRRLFGLNLGLVVDFLFDPEDRQAAIALFGEAADCLLAQDADVVACQFIGPSSVAAALRRAGFCRFPRRLLPRRFPLYISSFNSGAGAASIAMDPAPWYLTWGDNDAV